MAFLYLMNIIHIVKNRAMSICRFVRTAFIGHRETAIVKIEGLVDSGYLQSSKKMMGDYRERLFDYCQKRGFQVLVLLEVNSFNKSCQNWTAKKVLQLVEKQYINTIIIVGGISQKRWIEILKSMIKRKVEIEYLSTSEDINTYR